MLVPAQEMEIPLSILNLQNRVTRISAQIKTKKFTWTVKRRDAQSNMLVARGWEERKVELLFNEHKV